MIKLLQANPKIETSELIPSDKLLNSYVFRLNSNNFQDALKTGVSDFDNLTGGLQDFVVLGGKAGAGKTTLATQFSLGVAMNEKVPVIFYSFEMKTDDILTLILQNLSNKHLTRGDIINNDIQKPNSEHKKEVLKKALQKFSEFSNRFYIIDNTNGLPNIDQISTEISRVKKTHNAEKVLVVIDSFIDLVLDRPESQLGKAEEMVARQLELLQMQTGATILVIAHRRDDAIKGSKYEGLKGVSSIYHKPTTVLELISYKEVLQALEGENHPGARYERQEIERIISDPEVSMPSILYVSKNRNGTNKHINLRFYGAYRYYEPGKEIAFINENSFKIYSFFDKR